MTSNSYRMVLVGGPARSGTTLLARILSERAESLHFTGEAFFLGPAALASRSGELPAFLKQTRVAARLGGLGLDFSNSAYPGSFGELLEALFEATGGDQTQALVEHSPHSLEFMSAYADFCDVDGAFHIIRDGRATWNSLLGTDFGSRKAVPAASWWKASLATGLALEQTGKAHRAHYEDLVRNPEATITQVMASAGLRPAAEGNQNLPVDLPKSASETHALVNKAPDPSRIDSWRSSLSERQIRSFESVAGALLEELGYGRCFFDPPASPGRRMYETQVDLVANLVQLSPRRLLRLFRR